MQIKSQHAGPRGLSIGSENVAEQWVQDWLFFFRVLQLLLGAGGMLLNGGLVLQIIQLNPQPAVCNNVAVSPYPKVKSY